MSGSSQAAEDSARPGGGSVAAWLCFGVATALAILGLPAGLPSPVDRLLVGAGTGALLTALGWIALLALRRGGRWTWAVVLGFWIPYVNLLLAARYAQRHWHEDAARPGWLALAGMVAQLVAGLRLLLAEPLPLA